MGCDIHAFAEVREKKKWIKLDDRFENDYPKSMKCEWCEKVSEVTSDRNYDLFGLLAGVRGDIDIEEISPPKGIPEDASHGYLHKVEYWDGDCHSHSYFTLKELKESLSGNERLLQEPIDRLEKAKKEIIDEWDLKLGDEDIRMVFFFDN